MGLTFEDIHNQTTSAQRLANQAKVKDVKENSINNSWTIGIVDRSADTRITEWGTQHVNVPILNDGDLVRYNRETGEYQTLGEPSTWTDDFKAKAFEFQKRDLEDAEEWTRFYELEKTANEVANDINNRTTLWDAIVASSTVTIAQKPLVMQRPGEAYSEARESSNEMFKDVWGDFLYGTSIVRGAMDYQSKDYQEWFDKDPEAAIKALNDDNTLTDRAKEYYKYAVVNKTGKSLGKTIATAAAGTGLELLQSFGDASDMLHGTTAIKAAVQWKAAQEGSDIFDKSHLYTDLKNKSLGEAILDAYRYDYVNESRAKYDYDTGSLGFDLVLELISDPETWVTATKHIAKRITAQQIAKQVGNVDAYKHIGNALEQGLSDPDAIEFVVKSVTQDAAEQDALRVIVKDVVERKNAYKLAKTTGMIGDFINDADEVAKWISGMKLMTAAWQPIKMAANIIKDGGGTLVDKIRIRNLAKALAEVGPEIVETKDPVYMLKLADKVKIENTAVSLAEGVSLSDLDFFSKDMIFDAVARSYATNVAELRKEIRAAIGRWHEGDIDLHELYAESVKRVGNMRGLYVSYINELRLLKEKYMDKTEKLIKSKAPSFLNAPADSISARKMATLEGRLSAFDLEKEYKDAERKLRKRYYDKGLGLGDRDVTVQICLMKYAELQKRTYESLELIGKEDSMLFKELTLEGKMQLCSTISSQVTTPQFIQDAVADFNGDHYILEHIQDVHGRSGYRIYEDTVKKYRARLNKAKQADELINNPELLSIIDAINSDTDESVKLIQYAISAQKDDPIRQIISNMSGIKNYITIRKLINDSSYFSDNQKKALIDTLFDTQLSKRIEGSFKSEYVYSSAERLGRRSRGVAKTWIDTAFGLQTYYDEKLSNKFSDLKCCTPNTAENVKRIKEVASEMGQNTDKNKRYMYYSVKIDSDGAVDEITMMYENEAPKTFKMKSIEDKREFDKYMDKYMRDPRAIGATRKLEMIGFNTHVSGYGTDGVLRDTLSCYRSVHATKFTSTIDLAELKRIEAGLWVPTDEQYEAITNALSSCVTNYLGTVAVMKGISIKPKFKLTPMNVTDASRLVASIEALENAPDYLIRLKDTMSDSIIGLDYYGRKLNLVSFDDSKGILKLREAGLRDVELKKVYDANIHKAYINPDKFTDKGLTISTESLDTIANIRAIEKRLDKEQVSTLLSSFEDGDREVLRVYIDILKNSESYPLNAAIEEAGLVLEDINHKGLSTMQRISVIMYIAQYLEPDEYKHLFQKDDAGLTMINSRTVGKGSRVTLANPFRPQKVEKDLGQVLCDRTQSSVLLKGVDHKWFDELEQKPGMLGREDNAWEDLFKAEEIVTELEEQGASEIAVRRRLKELGIEEPFAELSIHQKAAIRKSFRDDFDAFYAELFKDYMSDMDRMYRAGFMPDWGMAYGRLKKNVQTGIYEKANSILYSEMIQRRATFINCLSRFSSDELATFLNKYCMNRMVIDTKVLDFNQMADVSKLSKFCIDNGFGCSIDEELGYVRIYLKKDVEYNFVEDTLRRFPVSDRVPMFVNPNLDDAFGYSTTMVPNSKLIEDNLTSKLFDGVDDLLEAEPGTMSRWNCSIIGTLEDIRFEGTYISNNPMINIANGATMMCKVIETNTDLVKAIFKGPNAAKQFELLNGVRFEDLRNRTGLVAVALTADKNGVLGVSEITSKKLMDSPYTKLLSYNDYMSLQKILKGEAQPLAPRSNILKAIANWQNELIGAYLFTNPATWVRNFMDSTIKGVMSEGTSHIPYMMHAVEANTNFEYVLEQMAKEGAYLKSKSVDLFFDKHIDDMPMTKEMFKTIWDYYMSSVSPVDVQQLYSDTIKRLMEQGVEFPDKFVKKYVIEEVEEVAKPMKQAYRALQKFNADKFEWVETTNRLAIYLHNMDKGKSPDQALVRVGLSQFDYTKTKTMQGINRVLPFVSFRLQNYSYWLEDGIKENYMFRHLIDLYDFKTEEVSSDEKVRYDAWVDTLWDDFEKSSEYEHVYNTYEDYKGADKSIALDYGWIKISDKLYFKLGISMLDAFTGLFDSASTLFGENLFDPISKIAGLFGDLANGIVHGEPIFSDLKDGADRLFNGATTESERVALLKDLNWLLSFTEMGTLLYRVESMVRNYALADRQDQDIATTSIATLMPGLFALAKQEVEKETYLDRPVGTDWYNRDDEYKATHRFVQGISTVPGWFLKDPTTYINVYGRMEAMGLNPEQWFEDGGASWFEQNNDGSYTLKNAKLMVNDEETYNKLYRDLMAWGWSGEEAEYLLSRAAEKKWLKEKKETKTTPIDHKTNKKWLGNVKVSRVNPYTYSNVSSGRGFKAKFTTSPLNPVRTTVQQRENNMLRVQWHKRTDDIYKQNYAKYGASRMAMRQNPKNYTNRSITEMYRTEQTNRYNKIHNRRHW